MPATAVEICNMALARIGVGQRISALDDPSEAAIQCATFYQQALEQALSAAMWSFATKRYALGVSSIDPPAEWFYRYSYPADCLFARFIEDGRRVRREDESIPFSVEGDGTTAGKSILCDQPDAILVYTWNVSNPVLFTPWFVDAFAWLLAAEIAMPLSVALAIEQTARQRWMMARDEAITTGFREGTPDVPPESEFITVRS